MKKEIIRIPKLRDDQLQALFALIAGCDLIHDPNCRRCRKMKNT